VSRAIATWATAVLAAAFLATAAAPAAEAKGGGHSQPPNSSSPSGNDIGWPQCGGAYPHGQAFGIVGVNDGVANTWNPCLADELAWADASSGGTKIPLASLYVNTADPGQVIDQISDWPTSGTAGDGYGTCDGSNSPACSWVYGWQRATADLAQLATTGATPSSYTWWLDVETGNTWESGSADALANNVADLEGMVAAFRGVATVGIYSTSYQWGVIIGGTPENSSLYGLPNWIPGGRTQSAAQANCSLPSFTSGQVVIAQWFGRFDGDVSCIG
jgi:hypothetical protein